MKTPKHSSKKLGITKLYKSSVIYIISSIVNASIPFVLLPLLTSRLSQSEYGLVSMFTTLFGFMMPFVGLNVEAAIQKRLYVDKHNIREYIGNGIFISLIALSIVIILSIIGRDFIFKITGLNTFWVILCAFYCFTQLLTLILLVVFQTKIKNKR